MDPPDGAPAARMAWQGRAHATHRLTARRWSYVVAWAGGPFAKGRKNGGWPRGATGSARSTTWAARTFQMTAGSDGDSGRCIAGVRQHSPTHPRQGPCDGCPGAPSRAACPAWWAAGGAAAGRWAGQSGSTAALAEARTNQAAQAAPACRTIQQERIAVEYRSPPRRTPARARSSGHPFPVVGRLGTPIRNGWHGHRRRPGGGTQELGPWSASGSDRNGGTSRCSARHGGYREDAPPAAGRWSATGTTPSGGPPPSSRATRPKIGFEPDGPKRRVRAGAVLSLHAPARMLGPACRWSRGAGPGP